MKSVSVLCSVDPKQASHYNDQIQIAPSIDKGRIWIKILDDNLEA